MVLYLGKYRQEGWPLGSLVLTVTSQNLRFRHSLKVFHVQGSTRSRMPRSWGFGGWEWMSGGTHIHTPYPRINPWELPLAKPGLPSEALVLSMLSIWKVRLGCPLLQL